MNVRSVVATRLASQCRRFPELDLTPLDTSGMDARDASLAIAINHAVARRWLTLVAVIESQLDRSFDDLEAKVQAAMLSGAAQLLLLDRLPDHAVIHETVEWAKRNVRPKAGGMVNAVLRQISSLRKTPSPNEPAIRTVFAADELLLSDGRVWQLTESVFAGNSLERLAQQTSHPVALITQWNRQLGPEAATKVALHSLVNAPIIMHGTELADNSRLAAHSKPGFFVFTGSRDELVDLLQQRHDAVVQDPTSSLPMGATADLEPRIILDVCAGLGTKTRQLALLHPNARIIATDIDEGRLRTLREHFSGHERVQVIDYDQLRELDGQVDLVIFDVPCTNTGVLARRVEAKYRWSVATVEKLADVQRQIMADAVPLFAPRCHVLFSTCSIEAAENRAQADWLTKWHGFRLVRDHGTLPAGSPGEPAADYSDGGYFALLSRE